MIDISFGAYQWLVLEQEPDACLLITKDIVAYRHFDATAWEGSALRKWLNRDFLCLGFSDAEQESILQTQVINSHDAYAEPGTARDHLNPILCADTMDKVFLLNATQTFRYFPDTESRIAIWQNAGDWWLLRSGILIDYDGWMFSPTEGNFGVRPALRIPTDVVSSSKLK